MGLGKTFTVVAFTVTLLTNPLIKAIEDSKWKKRKEKRRHKELAAATAMTENANNTESQDLSVNQSSLGNDISFDEEPQPAKRLIFRVLIIVPKNTLQNWIEEFKKWTPSDLLHEIPLALINSSSGKGEKQKRKYAIKNWFENGGVLVLGYEMLRTLVEEKEKPISSEIPKIISDPAKGVFASDSEEFQYYLLKPGADLVIADEAHTIKNAKSKVSQVLELIDTKRRIALTGSPLQNNLDEYWVMVNWVKRLFLYTPQEYKRIFVVPIKAGSNKDASNFQILQMKKRTHVLYRKLTPIVHRKDNSELRNALNPKREFILSIKMTSFQKFLYKYYLSKLPSSGKTLFRAYQCLMRIWNHPCNMVLHYFEDLIKQKNKQFKQESSATAEQSTSKGAGRPPLPKSASGTSLKLEWKPSIEKFRVELSGPYSYFVKCQSSSSSNLLNEIEDAANKLEDKMLHTKEIVDISSEERARGRRNNEDREDDYNDETYDQEFRKQLEEVEKNFTSEDSEDDATEGRKQDRKKKSLRMEDELLDTDVGEEDEEGTWGEENESDDEDEDDDSFVVSDNYIEYDDGDEEYVVNDSDSDFIDDEEDKNENDEGVVDISEENGDYSDKCKKKKRKRSEKKSSPERKRSKKEKSKKKKSEHHISTDGKTKKKTTQEIYSLITSPTLDLTAEQDEITPENDEERENDSPVRMETPSLDDMQPNGENDNDNDLSSHNNISRDECDLLAEEEPQDELGVDWWRFKEEQLKEGIANNSNGIPENISVSNEELFAFSNKMTTLFALLALSVKNKDKMLVFSQSLYTLNLIELFLGMKNWGRMTKVLDSDYLHGCHLSEWKLNQHYLRIDGQISNRQKIIHDFNNSSNFKLMLISTKAGNMGINLQSANRVVIFDSSWNPVHDLQAIFRSYRFGQKKNVFVYRLYASGSMEEKIHKNQVVKQSLSERVVDAKMPENHFTDSERAELMQLVDEEEEDDEKDEALVSQEEDSAEGELISSTTKCSKTTRKQDKNQKLLDIIASGTKDDVLLELIGKLGTDFFASIQDHDSLLADKTEDHLNEEEQQAAFDEFEREKAGISVLRPPIPLQQQQQPTVADPSVVTPVTPQTMQNQELADRELADLLLGDFKLGSSSSLPSLLDLSRYPTLNQESQKYPANNLLDGILTSNSTGRPSLFKAPQQPLLPSLDARNSYIGEMTRFGNSIGNHDQKEDVPMPNNSSEIAHRTDYQDGDSPTDPQVSLSTDPANSNHSLDPSLSNSVITNASSTAGNNVNGNSNNNSSGSVEPLPPALPCLDIPGWDYVLDQLLVVFKSILPHDTHLVETSRLLNAYNNKMNYPQFALEQFQRRFIELQSTGYFELLAKHPITHSHIAKLKPSFKNFGKQQNQPKI
jgi:SNF2 family DNA or RNA helicase